MPGDGQPIPAGPAMSTFDTASSPSSGVRSRSQRVCYHLRCISIGTAACQPEQRARRGRQTIYAAQKVAHRCTKRRLVALVQCVQEAVEQAWGSASSDRRRDKIHVVTPYHDDTSRTRPRAYVLARSWPSPGLPLRATTHIRRREFRVWSQTRASLAACIVGLEPSGRSTCRGPATFDSAAFRDCAGPLLRVH